MSFLWTILQSVLWFKYTFHRVQPIVDHWSSLRWWVKRFAILPCIPTVLPRFGRKLKKLPDTEDGSKLLLTKCTNWTLSWKKPCDWVLVVWALIFRLVCCISVHIFIQKWVFILSYLFSDHAAQMSAFYDFLWWDHCTPGCSPFRWFTITAYRYSTLFPTRVLWPVSICPISSEWEWTPPNVSFLPPLWWILELYVPSGFLDITCDIIYVSCLGSW